MKFPRLLVIRQKFPDRKLVDVAAVGLSLFFVLGSLIQIVGIVFSKPLADRFGKKAVFIAGMAVTAIATALVFFVTPTSMTLLVVLSILWPIGARKSVVQGK